MIESSLPPFEAVDGMTDEQAFATGYDQLEKQEPESKTITLNLDSDVADFFLAQGDACNTMVNTALRAFMESKIRDAK